ncbi:MAG: sugar ABC transporter ATP-binding protein [Ilumatobacteraceae bacterium]
MLRIEHLSKTFAGQAALSDVSITIAAGEVHALVGQNGSGKSTLIKVLSGYHQPDDGASAWAGGEPLTLGDGHAAAAAGIRFVHQDLGLVLSLSAVENIALTAGYHTGVGGRIHWRDEVRRTRQSLEVLGLADIDVKAPVGDLAPSQRTAVAIARALVGWEDGANLLVLDEPTANLPGDDVHRLFEVIHRLKARGVSIVYVSHHLDEVFELADQVTVLRDGKLAATVPVTELDHLRLVELIVGHHVETTTASDPHVSGAPLVTVRGLHGGRIHGLDFDVSAGEILGFAGITGSGREHVVALIAGQLPRDDGEVLVDGAEIANYQPRQVIRAGVVSVPAERAVRGTIPPMNVRENMTISDVGRHFVTGRLRRRGEIDEAVDWVGRLSIKTASTESLIGSLSGGNQQKVMFAKALRLSPRVLMLDEPTQGVDVGAKEQIHQLVDAAAAEGVATIVASTDTDELVRLCHRVIVLTDGTIRATLVGAQIATERIEHTQLESSRRAS